MLARLWRVSEGRPPASGQPGSRGGMAPANTSDSGESPTDPCASSAHPESNQCVTFTGTQVLCKLLPPCWDPARVQPGVPQPLARPDVSPARFQSPMLWGLLFPVQVPRLGLRPLSLWGDPTVARSSHCGSHCGSPPRDWGGCVPPALLTVASLFRSCKKSAGPWGVLRDSGSVYSCCFGVRGEVVPP